MKVKAITADDLTGETERKALIQQGRKEVVEFMSPRMAMHKSGLMQTNIDYIEWRAKLKKWGIGE